MSFLGATKKSGTLDRKNSAKLPKLTIQQQIDNNQIIERMNRKITFTKNQRHLGKTLQYVEAFQSTNSGSVFRVEPVQLYFTNFQVNKIYESELKLVNKSKHIQRIKITPLQKKQFVVSNVVYPLENSGDIAPGMQVLVYVRFKPTNLHDIQDELLIIVGDGVVRVPIKAQREKCRGEWPQQINCGHCWVGDHQLRQVTIMNQGGQAIYRLQNAQGQVEGKKSIGVFKIWPTEIKIQKGVKNMIYVDFSPNNKGLFQQQVVYVSNQGEQQKIRIKLKGGAYSAQITLDQINNQKVLVKKFHNFLYLNNCEPGNLSTSNFKIHNHAVVPVDFQWYFQSEPNFEISQEKGKIGPSQLMNFTAKFTPSSRNPKIITAFLYLFNLPKQSILNNSTSRVINGVEMIQCLKLQVRVTSKDSNMNVSPIHKRISQKLFLGRQKRTSFTIHNSSEVDRKYRIQTIKIDQHCETVCQNQGERVVKAGDTQQLWFSFKITELTHEVQQAFFLIHFDNQPSKLISIQGRVQFPSLLLYNTDVDFELLRTHSVFRKRFKIYNPGENDVQFKFHNQHRFYHLDFYDFYEFEDEQFYQDRLKILSNNQEFKQWIVVPSHSQQVLQFQIHTKDPEQFGLDVKLIVKNGDTYSIRVQGQVEQAFGKMSQNFIPIKQIFQGNVYNSNKFLPKELSIDNPGNVKFSYEIICPEIQECLINVSQQTGSVQAKGKKRLYMTLQPLKTGPFSPVFIINFYDNIPMFPQNYTSLDEIIQIVPQSRKKLFKIQQLKIEGKIRGVQTSYYIKDESRAKKVAQKLTDDGHGSVKMSSYSHKSNTASKSHYLQSYKIVYPPLQQLNFFNCQINKVEQLEIIIENNSELTTQYEIFAENYRSIEKAASETKSMAKGMMQGQELAFTSNMGKNYLQNRALNQAQKIYLSNNKGISIMCEPSAGVLHKKQSQKIVVTMFNDTSGRFKDSLVISVKDHEIKKFPINMQIKGTPVSLSRNQLGINFNKQIPFLNAGTFLRKNGKSTRNIKILNNGPRQVELKWMMYPYASTKSDQDIFQISFVGAQPGSNNLVEINWQAIKPKPLQRSPFSISPPQKLIKGRQQVNFLLTIQQSQQSENLQALVIGEPTMIEQTGKVLMEQLAIVVSAQMVHPQLKIDQKHQNHINKFQRFAVIGNQYRTKANDFHRKLKLKNHQRCNLNFTVQIQTVNSNKQFFQIVSSSTDSSLNKLKPKTLTTTINKTKALNTSIPVEVQREFILPYESYVQIGIDLKGNPKDTNEWPEQSKIRKDGNLIINFANGERQVIPLVGWLYRPTLFIQMPNNQLHSIENMVIDFGVVHVNNHKKKSIYIANPTKSAADWSISYVKYQQTKTIAFQKQLWTDLDYQDENITDQKKCFRLSHDSGHLLAQSIPIHYIPGTLALYNADDSHAQTHKPFKLDFVFKPENNVLYKSKFLLKVQYGPTYEIVLRGKGTFEQEAQIK